MNIWVVGTSFNVHFNLRRKKKKQKEGLLFKDKMSHGSVQEFKKV